MRGLALKTLHKYLTRQVLATLLLTVAVFAFVVVLVNGLKDVLPLLFSGHVGLRLVAEAVGLTLPFAFVYALPMSFITATLLVFGRFSADQELTATRAGGISLLSLVTPVLLLSLLCCGLSAWFNLLLGPQSRAAFLNLKQELLSSLTSEVIPEKQFISGFYGVIVYVDKNREGLLENITVYESKSSTNVYGQNFFFRAPTGHLQTDLANKKITLVLNDLVGVRPTPNGQPKIDHFTELSFLYDTKQLASHSTKPKISDMTFAQLQEEMRELQDMGVGTIANNFLAAKNSGTNSSPEEIETNIRAAEKVRQGEISRVRFEMHREIAFSFACFGFTLIGIPLGIRVHRRETNVGIGIALGLVVVYYGFIMLGASLSARPEFYPHLIVWIPNFIFQTVGAALLWRANRGI